MPTTRSATKTQAKLEDFAEASHAESQNSTLKSPGRKSQSARKMTASANSSAKRKGSQKEQPKPKPLSKKRKQQHLSSDNITHLESPIVINRAPVLQLWGGVVASFLHPDLSWPACLSIGNAISTLCAISKGRAIGMVEPKDDGKSEDRKVKKEQVEEEAEEFSVMGFPLHLKGDAVLMSGKPKSFNEVTLKNKFGEEHYNAAKNAMSEALDSWSDEKDELDKKAFHMYEKFRPNVATGHKGWGRKGELNLHEVVSIIKKPEE